MVVVMVAVNASHVTQLERLGFKTVQSFDGSRKPDGSGLLETGNFRGQ